MKGSRESVEGAAGAHKKDESKLFINGIAPSIRKAKTVSAAPEVWVVNQKSSSNGEAVQVASAQSTPEAVPEKLFNFAILTQSVQCVRVRQQCARLLARTLQNWQRCSRRDCSHQRPAADFERVAGSAQPASIRCFFL
jgi:hypothetical protein